MCNHFDKAQDYFKTRSVKDLQYADFDDFLKTLSVGGKTKKNIMTSIIAMYGYLKHRREISEVPEFPKVEFELGFRKTVDKDVQQAIIDDVEKHEPFKVWLGIRFLATYISIRPMELMNLTWGNIDAKNGYIYIPHPKEKKYKAVPILPQDMVLLTGQAREMPTMYLFGGGKRYGANRFYKAWKRACARLNIEGVDLYGGTRHSSARALRKHFSPEEIKRATMHSTNAAFERYFCMESDDVRSIYKRSADVIQIDTALTPKKAPISGG
jgi:integrase